jgi:hypothetical protein
VHRRVDLLLAGLAELPNDFEEPGTDVAEIVSAPTMVFPRLPSPPLMLLPPMMTATL